MNEFELKAGIKVMYTPTGKIFELAKVTDKRVSWYTGNVSKGGSGKNNLRMTCTSVRIFKRGIENGTYKIIYHPDRMTETEIAFVKKFIVKGN